MKNSLSTGRNLEQDPPADGQQSYTCLQFPLVLQELSYRYHLFVGSLKLWAANKAKVIADFLMRPCWAESPKMSSCLWICCHLGSFKVTCKLQFYDAVLFKLNPQGVKL